MRVLVTVQPGIGHLRPLVPYAQALSARGHEVVVGSTEAFRPEVTKFQLPFVGLGLNFTLAAASATIPDIPPPGPQRMPWMTPFFCHRTAVATCRDILALAERWTPDVIVREYLEYGAALAGEKLGIPHVVAGPIWFRNDPAVDENLRVAALEVGLSASSSIGFAFRYGALAAMPPCWLADDESVPSNVVYVRPGFERQKVRSVADVHPAFTRIHVTLGTTEANRIPGFYSMLINALAGICDELIVGLGREQSPNEFDDIPPNVRVDAFVDHVSVLPACDLVVCNGGYGTIMAALASGVPLLIVPVHADQPRNARRCRSLGVGDFVTKDECTEQSLRDAATRILSQSQYSANARTIAAELAKLPPPRDVVELLERFCTAVVQDDKI